MSWDIVLFNTTEKVDDFEDLNVDELDPIDFGQILENYFKEIKKDDKHREAIGDGFTLDYFDDGEPATNFMVSLYGENAIYAIAHLAKTNGWQVFDTGLGEMLDLDNPSNNGYDNFQSYLKSIQNQ
jgi:hypothetical protein